MNNKEETVYCGNIYSVLSDKNKLMFLFLLFVFGSIGLIIGGTEFKDDNFWIRFGVIFAFIASACLYFVSFPKNIFLRIINMWVITIILEDCVAKFSENPEKVAVLFLVTTIIYVVFFIYHIIFNMSFKNWLKIISKYGLRAAFNVDGNEFYKHVLKIEEKRGKEFIKFKFKSPELLEGIFKLNFVLDTPKKIFENSLIYIESIKKYNNIKVVNVVIAVPKEVISKNVDFEDLKKNFENKKFNSITKNAFNALVFKVENEKEVNLFKEQFSQEIRALELRVQMNRVETTKTKNVKKKI